MVEKDYQDITPKGVDKEAKGQAGKKTTVFQETEIAHIQDNPMGLTKEGIEKKIAIWSKSVNAHVTIKYKALLQSCKNVQPSGKTKDGEIIFARDKKGNPTWVDVKEYKGD